jgi:hypothetical protein
LRAFFELAAQRDKQIAERDAARVIGALPFPVTDPRPEAVRALVGVSNDGRTMDIGTYIDSAAAKEKRLDREALAAYERIAGRAPHDLGFLEADLIVTTTGLFYVTPKAHCATAFFWRNCTVSKSKARGRFAQVNVVELRSGVHAQFTVGAHAAENILAVAAHYDALA